MNSSLTDHIRQMLLLGKKIVKTSPLLADEVGTVNVKGDKTIGMDVKIERGLIDYVKQNKLPFNIFSEEIGTVKFHPNPEYLIAFDPLDGSTNYKLGKNLLPYGLLVACYKGLTPKLSDVVAAGAIEHTTNLGWIYDGRVTKTLDGKLVKLDKKWEINKSTPVYLDLYYKKAYAAFSPLPEKVHVRWMGSNIASLIYTLSQVSAVLGAYQMRPEEIGTMVSLIKGAGGVAVDHKGRDLGRQDFSTETTYQILAGNKSVVDFMVSQLG